MRKGLRHRHHAGLFRREVLQVGVLGALGISADVPLCAAPLAGHRGTAKSVILVWLPGGPPQMQLWDLKPDSPAECRGSARPIRTSAAGITFGHWLPETAKVAHLAQEPVKLREAYGLPSGPVDHPRLKSFGPSLLLARRLVEAGVRFVQVNLGDENF